MRIERVLSLAFAILPLTSVAVAQDDDWARGVDVCSNEGPIDWRRVKASGLSFAIARVSHGLDPDTAFEKYWAGMKAGGIVRGVYQYFRPDQDAIEQADLLLSSVGAFEPGDLPPFLDVEDMGDMSSREVSAQVVAWVKYVKAKTGLTPIVYTYPSFWEELAHKPDLPGVELWIARYGVDSPDVPAPWSDWKFWQYSPHADVDGIGSDSPDSDVFHGTPAELRAFAASHGVPSASKPSGGSAAPGGSASVGVVGRLEDPGHAASSGSAPAPKPTASDPTRTNTPATTYTIDFGDTLGAIAETHGMSVEELLAFHGNRDRLAASSPMKGKTRRLDPNLVFPGQKIEVPE